MKKITLSIIGLMMVVALCGCGSSSSGTGGNNPGASGGNQETKAGVENPPDSSIELFEPKTHRICYGASSSAVLMGDGTVQCTLDQSPDQYIIVDGNWKSWKDIVDISMNEEILAAVKSDGTVVWDGGRKKDYDFLNDPSINKEIESWKNVVQVSACHDTVAALCKDGSVKMTGGLITEDLEETSGFKQISVYDAFFGLRMDGTIYCCAPYTYVDQTWKYETDSWTNIQQISAGFDYAVGLKEDGTVVATGNKESGACDVEEWTDIVQVVAGCNHTIGLKSDGTLVWCGNFIDDGIGKMLDEWTDIEEVAGFFNVVIGLKSDGSIVYAGYERDLLPVEATNIHD